MGIFTPVAASNIRLVFSANLISLAEMKQSFAPVAGTHMMIRPEGCLPVYYCTTEPMSVAEGYQGTPIFHGDDFVFPRQASGWIFCPAERQAVNICVGALTGV